MEVAGPLYRTASKQDTMATPRNWILTDFLSKSHSQQLKASLFSYFNVQKPLGDFVPNGYHLLYFNPKHDEESLSKDGYDAHQQPPDETFKRRLWASGELNFLRPIEFNKLGLCVENIERVRKLGNNEIVTLNREIISGDEVCLEEKRSLIYTNELYRSGSGMQRETRKPDFAHILKPSSLLLFRYSGLTFNAHKIHYDKQYALTEGYPDILVQGPLTVTLLLEWLSLLFSDLNVKSFKYKNHSPIFADDKIKLALSRDTETQYSVWIEGEERQLHLSGSLSVE